MKTEPYLFFDGHTEEAIEFYKKALGAQVVQIMRFKENPQPEEPGMRPAGTDEKVMHAQIKIGDTSVMMSDGRCLGSPAFKGFGLTVSVPTEAEAARVFSELGQGGQVQMPMAKTFFSPAFGMVADKFGVAWMVIADSQSR